MATYQTQSKVSIIGTVPAEVRGGTVTSTILGTVVTQVLGGTVTATILGTVQVTGPFFGTVGVVGTIATILSPIQAQVTPPKRGTITTQRVATVPINAVATLLDPNPNRAQYYLRLIDTGTIFVGLAATVSLATFSIMLMDYEMMSDDVYTGVVTAIALGSNVRVVVHEV